MEWSAWWVCVECVECVEWSEGVRGVSRVRGVARVRRVGRVSTYYLLLRAPCRPVPPEAVGCLEALATAPPAPVRMAVEERMLCSV